MAVLRWVVLVLAFFLSPQSSLAAVDENWLKDIVLHIRNEYELGDTYSLAVNVPVNQDPDSLTEVLQDDRADSVKQALSLGQVYQGTRIVAAAQSDALARVLEKVQPLIKSSEGNVLIVYSEGYPKANGIASKITSIIQNWRSYAFVFSKLAEVADADITKRTEEFKQQELSTFGLENIFRCYEPDDSFQCTNCRAGSDVAPSCVADMVQSNDEQEAGAEIGSPATDSGTDEGYDSGPNNWLGPGLAISSNQDIDEGPYVAEGMTNIMGGRRARKVRNRQKGKKGEMLKEEGEQGKLGQGGKVKEGGKRGRGGRVRKGGKRGRGGRVRKGGKRGRGSRVRKGGKRGRGSTVRKGGKRGRGGRVRKGGKRGRGGRVRKGGKRGRGGRVRKGGKRGRGGGVRKAGRRGRGSRVRKGGKRGRGGGVRKAGRRGRGSRVRKGGKRGRGGGVRKAGRRGRGSRVRKGGKRGRGSRVRKGGKRGRGGRVRKGGRRRGRRRG
ncbi:uncharacterized protein V3H82_026224 [Fundulus diaphanus]